ncbi:MULTISPECIES: alpha/beta hydrolase [Glycomyces]|uniref:Alpha/beta hydrolase n=2 Tax=Glycomyces TaxID=58113 RepID=A0A9X3PNT3_9ACTN|nr:alpha/beta hydrolase [Glycomyces lechevalierae]MDA1386467.1 alpha/beta hydrolase [Glycomyces lechevalierae]MDR7338983.1 pimeloyl-ACP methyl ester carboxylesterase/DNA-binding transcriptional MerR regulator [Glycomyces lechevalierae]
MSKLTWQTLRDTDFSGMSDTVALWQSYIEYATTTIVDLPEEIKLLSEAGEEDFSGPVAEASRGYVAEVVDVFEEDLAERATRIQTLLDEAKGAFETQQSALNDLFSEAGGDLLPEGGIGEERFKVLRSFASDHHQAEVTDEQQTLYDRAEALSTEFKTIMTDTRRIDDDLAAELDKLDDSAPAMPPVVGEPGFAERNGEYLREKHQDFLEKIDDGEAGPAEVTEWWDSMSEEERALFVATAPDLVGPLDGIPTEDRDTANRDLLDEEITDLDAQIARMESELENTPRDGRYIDLEEEIEALREQRDSLDNLNNQIAEPFTSEDGSVSASYYLLGYSSEADGQAIVSVGNPDTADNVNVYVPGTGGNLADVNGLLSRTESTYADAYQFGPAGSTTASVLWLGYDAPDNVALATDPSYAENAASSLSSFTEGLRSTDQGAESNLTMTGHSYGSTTVGVAARDEGLDVDNMIFVGSPGVGVDTAADLGIDPDNVWASRNEEDVIGQATDTNTHTLAGAAAGSWAGPGGAVVGGAIGYLTADKDEMIHGTDPTADSFGGNTFASDATRDNTGEWYEPGADAVSNHSAYWDEGNAARENMAYIITGQRDEVSNE